MTAPSLEWLRTFAAFARHLSFTRAAGELHLSQPAVHMHVKKLSEQLGVTLYRRRGRALELTREGRRTLAHARELLQRSESFMSELHGVEPDRPLVIAAGEGTFLYLLGPTVRSALSRGIRLSALVRDSLGTLDAVETSAADIGIMVADEPPPSLESEVLREVGTKVVVPKSHRLAKRARLKLGDLDGERTILPPAGRPQRVAFEIAARAAQIRYDVGVEVRGWPLSLHFAQLGVGLALVNDLCRIPRSLVAIPLAGLPRQTYRAVRRADALRPETAETVWSLLTRLRTV